MLSWDGFGKAWNVLEWNFSFSISDGVMLVIAAATTVLAFLTYRIQKEQKRVVERQNEIIERQVTIDEAKFERENTLLKSKLNQSVFNIANFYMMGHDPHEEWFELLNDNSDILDQFFNNEFLDFIHSLKNYSLLNEDGLIIGGDLRKSEALDKIRKDYYNLFLSLKFDPDIG